MRIALDAMGGDKAPVEVIAGALDAIEHIDNDKLVLFGDERAIQEHLGDRSRWRKSIEIIHAPEVVGMDESPVESLRRKRNSSIAVMAKMDNEQLLTLLRLVTTLLNIPMEIDSLIKLALPEPESKSTTLYPPPLFFSPRDSILFFFLSP